jgi:hypothetical protein
MLPICKHNIIRGLYSLQLGDISSISDKLSNVLSIPFFFASFCINKPLHYFLRPPFCVITPLLLIKPFFALYNAFNLRYEAFDLRYYAFVLRWLSIL